MIINFKINVTLFHSERNNMTDLVDLDRLIKSGWPK